MTKILPKASLRCIDELPTVIPVFPLLGVILLPRGVLPLTVFEPRYLALIDDVLCNQRVFGLVQPEPVPLPGAPGFGESPQEERDREAFVEALGRGHWGESPPGKQVPLYRIGCLGRLTAFSETDERHLFVSLTGICRFKITGEQETDLPYRVFEVDYNDFVQDCEQGFGEELVDRTKLLKVLKNYLDLHDLSADWESIHGASTEHLVNSLAMISPYGAEEKQALLEAENLVQRAEILIALAEMEMAQKEHGDSGSTLQ